MNTWIKVARLPLVGGMNYLAYPWFILGLNFFIALTLNGAVGGGLRSGELFAIYAAFIAMGVICVARWLPFALSLGVSRRSYYLGVSLLALALSAIDGLALTLLTVLEGATNGWSTSLHFFRVAYIFAGPWYQTWLTSFVLLTVAFVYGMWFGIVYRRWNLLGLVVFSSVQAVVLTCAALIATNAHAWASIGHFFTTLSAWGLTGLLAVLAAILLASGFATIRRIAV